MSPSLTAWKFLVSGVPAGGPSEPLVDDGSELGGPPAAPPVSAQDADTAYQSLIHGAGRFLSPLKQLNALWLPT